MLIKCTIPEPLKADVSVGASLENGEFYVLRPPIDLEPGDRVAFRTEDNLVMAVLRQGKVIFALDPNLPLPVQVSFSGTITNPEAYQSLLEYLEKKYPHRRIE